MHAEVITTGTELLLGQTVDTNSAYIARALTSIGLDLYYLITVGDNEARMASMLEQALERSDIIITTGGLGPTVDDVTRAAVARATGRPLVFREDLLADIEHFFARLGRQMTENNRRQAYIPAGAIPLRNPVGTAPAFILEDPRGTIICLPGVPREMEYLMQTEVLPYLSRKLGNQIIKTRILRTCAIGESAIDNLIGDMEQMSNPTVGLSAHPGQTDVRITAKGRDEEEVNHLIADVETEIRRRLGDVIFGVDQETLEGIVSELLIKAGLTLALSESNTSGMIAQRLRLALQERGKGELLVSTSLTAPYTIPIDPSAVLHHAWELAHQSGAGIALHVAGTGASHQGIYQSDPGQTYIALIAPTAHLIRPFRYGGGDSHTQLWVTYRALDILRRYLLGLSLEIQ